MRSLGLVVRRLAKQGWQVRTADNPTRARHLIRFRRTRRYGKPRNQRFHHIVLPTSRARGHHSPSHASDAARINRLQN